MIINTCTNRNIIQDLELLETFHRILEIPLISSPDEFKKVLEDLNLVGASELDRLATVFPRGGKLPIKKLIMATEMARQGSSSGVVERFYNAVKEM